MRGHCEDGRRAIARGRRGRVPNEESFAPDGSRPLTARIAAWPAVAGLISIGAVLFGGMPRGPGDLPLPAHETAHLPRRGTARAGSPASRPGSARGQHRSFLCHRRGLRFRRKGERGPGRAGRPDPDRRLVQSRQRDRRPFRQPDPGLRGGAPAGGREDPRRRPVFLRQRPVPLLAGPAQYRRLGGRVQPGRERSGPEHRRPRRRANRGRRKFHRLLCRRERRAAQRRRPARSGRQPGKHRHLQSGQRCRARGRRRGGEEPRAPSRRQDRDRRPLRQRQRPGLRWHCPAGGERSGRGAGELQPGPRGGRLLRPARCRRRGRASGRWQGPRRRGFPQHGRTIGPRDREAPSKRGVRPWFRARHSRQQPQRRSGQRLRIAAGRENPDRRELQPRGRRGPQQYRPAERGRQRRGHRDLRRRHRHRRGLAGLRHRGAGRRQDLDRRPVRWRGRPAPLPARPAPSGWRGGGPGAGGGETLASIRTSARPAR